MPLKENSSSHPTGITQTKRCRTAVLAPLGYCYALKSTFHHLFQLCLYLQFHFHNSMFEREGVICAGVSKCNWVIFCLSDKRMVFFYHTFIIVFMFYFSFMYKFIENVGKLANAQYSGSKCPLF